MYYMFYLDVTQGTCNSKRLFARVKILYSAVVASHYKWAEKTRNNLQAVSLNPPFFLLQIFIARLLGQISISWYKQSSPLFWLSNTLYANNFHLCTIGCFHSCIVQTVLEITDLEKTEQRNLTALNPSLYDFVYIHDPLLS